jgi:hypothetical protein
MGPYQLTSTAGLRVSAVTRGAAVDALTAHLLENVPAGPVSWTILSPWQLLWEGRLNLNGLTERATATVATHMEYVADGLAEEAAHPRPLS